MQDCDEGIMTVPASTEAAPAQASRRERKKLATRRQLRWVALALFAEHGFANVTVEEIAEAADVSPRTFFNYFPSKEAVLPGADPERILELRQRILTQPPEATALAALRAAIIVQARQAAAELAELSGNPADWLARMKATRADPDLRAAQAAHMAAIERAIAESLAERLGTDPDRDPYPPLLAAVGAGAFRTCLSCWASSGGIVPLDHLIDLAFGALAEGLPETTSLRTVLAAATRKGSI
jgi:AcrR family transcriptional regulator